MLKLTTASSLLQETPAATEAVITPTKETLHDLLMKETPAAVPLETVVVPAATTTVPAVAVSGQTQTLLLCHCVTCTDVAGISALCLCGPGLMCIVRNCDNIIS